MRDGTPLFASISFDSLIGDSGDYAPAQSDQLQHGYPGPMRMKQDRSHSWAPVRSMPYRYPAVCAREFLVTVVQVFFEHLHRGCQGSTVKVWLGLLASHGASLAGTLNRPL
jgi:hypothetical protein